MLEDVDKATACTSAVALLSPLLAISQKFPRHQSHTSDLRQEIPSLQSVFLLFISFLIVTICSGILRTPRTTAIPAALADHREHPSIVLLLRRRILNIIKKSLKSSSFTADHGT